jgi:hypothetical protein
LAEISLSDYKNLQQQHIAQKSELTNRLLDAERQLTEARRTQEEKVLTSGTMPFLSRWSFFQLEFWITSYIKSNKYF